METGSRYVPMPLDLCQTGKTSWLRRLNKKTTVIGGLECRGGDLDSRPRAYESPALPLSYLGKAAVGAGAPQILLWEDRFVNIPLQIGY